MILGLVEPQQYREVFQEGAYVPLLPGDWQNPNIHYAFLLSHETLSCENLGYHRQLSRNHAESQWWNQQMLLFALLGGSSLYERETPMWFRSVMTCLLVARAISIKPTRV